jgi:phosphomevalonate kinase
MSFSKKDNKCLIIKTPCKLILSGEWAVLEQNHPCIVLPINRFVTAKISHAQKFILNAPDINVFNLYFSVDPKNGKIFYNTLIPKDIKKKLKLSLCAIGHSIKFLHENNITIIPFKLILNSSQTVFKKPDGNILKLGLGSSAAITVSICKAILGLHNIDIYSNTIKDLIFKLSAIAHLRAQNGIGSCCDIAASCYQVPIIYTRFDPTYLSCNNNSLSSCVKSIWPGLSIKPVYIPPDLILCTGYTGKSVFTPDLISRLQDYKKNNLSEYNALCVEISQIVKALVLALKNNDSKKICELINLNSQVLSKLSLCSGLSLDSGKMGKLVLLAKQAGACAKISGAGAGDCGIALCFDKKTEQKVKASWRNSGIIPLDLKYLIK